MIYDLVVVVRADKVQKEAQNSLTTLLEKEGFKISDVAWWNKRELSYPINKQTSGQYLFATITADKTNPRNFIAKLKQNENVLRCLLLKKEHIKKNKKGNPKTLTKTAK